MSERPERRIAAVVLAAGCSARMGARNKLLVKLGDRSMLSHVVDAVLSSRARPVVVVTGYEARAVEADLGARPVVVARNSGFAEGLASSLRVGVAAVAGAVDGALICLGDMPLVGPAVLDRLIDAFDPAGGRAICAPVVKGRRGNPVLWDHRYFPEMVALSGDAGARALLERHAAAVHLVSFDDQAVLTDCDTPEAMNVLVAMSALEG